MSQFWQITLVCCVGPAILLGSYGLAFYAGRKTSDLEFKITKKQPMEEPNHGPQETY